MRSARPVALVTGAAVGIGQAVAIDLSQHGFNIAGTSRRVERLDATCSEVQSNGGEALPLALDVSNVDDISSAVDEVIARFGRIDVLVNNAGTTLRGPALEVTVQDWDEILATNLRAAFFASQFVAGTMMDAGIRGSIVNISSTHGRSAIRDRAVYGITKAAVDHMTRALALEWATAGIRVNAVVPATVATPSREAVFRDKAVRASLLTRIPLQRFAVPGEVAAAVRYLVSPEASFVTGTCLVIDGGLTTT